MGKRKFFIAGILVAAFVAATPVASKDVFQKDGALTASAQTLGGEYYVGGMPAGFSLGISGAQIVGFSQIAGENGSPAANAGLKTGDVIEKAAGIRVRTTAELNEVISSSNGKKLSLTVRRGGEYAEVYVVPVKDPFTGKYKIGILSRDTVSGIGTITYIEKNTRNFGALGHAVGGEHSGNYTGGEICSCTVVGVAKSVRGKAGELKGTLLNAKKIGEGKKVNDCGIFGTMDETYALEGNLTAYAATPDEVKIGNAYIYSTIEGETPKKYEIDVVKVDKNNKNNKNFVVKITDPVLLERTGGIVQGMSGSPVLQNGKLIGAITHVFINDPTRGYAVSIENMLNSAK